MGSYYRAADDPTLLEHTKRLRDEKGKPDPEQSLRLDRLAQAAVLQIERKRKQG